MKITKIILENNKFQNSKVLNTNLGDAFLYQHNQIFKNIRNECLKLGIKYNSNLDDQFVILPLSNLDNVLKDKVVSFYANAEVLEKINKINNNIELEEVVENLKTNYLFHESCHLVARNKSEQFFKNDKFDILQIFLEESFANTCELLALKDVDNEPHQLFYGFNSYTQIFEESKLINSNIKVFEFDILFKFTLICYVYSNFLKSSLSIDEISKIFNFLEYKNLDNQKLKIAKKFSEVTFTLDYNFRKNTSKLYLKLNNINHDYTKLNVYQLLNEKNNILLWLDEVCSVVKINLDLTK